MPVPTTRSLRNTQRRLNHRIAAQQRRQQAAARILEEMRNGASLHRCNRGARVIWVLSTGRFVTHEAVTDVMRDPRIVGVGDSLFGTALRELSQTFRYVE